MAHGAIPFRVMGYKNILVWVRLFSNDSTPGNELFDSLNIPRNSTGGGLSPVTGPLMGRRGKTGLRFQGLTKFRRNPDRGFDPSGIFGDKKPSSRSKW